MNRSDDITKISLALVGAQKEMENATKGSTNPFFKSTYANLNAVMEATLPSLNKHGISVLQPTVVFEGKNYVETILLHESGQFISSLTEIKSEKPNNPQAEGSGISYARRYGLQSITCIGAEDDDGNSATNNVSPVTAISGGKGQPAEVKRSHAGGPPLPPPIDESEDFAFDEIESVSPGPNINGDTNKWTSGQYTGKTFKERYLTDKKNNFRDYHFLNNMEKKSGQVQLYLRYCEQQGVK